MLAAVCAALIFVLGLFAASPVLHGQLHHDTTSSTKDDCAIVLFANGISVPLTVIALPPPSPEWCEQIQFSLTEVCLDSPRYLLQPERGPPAA
jgi:hypothetical protein